MDSRGQDYRIGTPQVCCLFSEYRCCSDTVVFPSRVLEPHNPMKKYFVFYSAWKMQIVYANCLPFFTWALPQDSTTGGPKSPPPTLCPVLTQVTASILWLQMTCFVIFSLTFEKRRQSKTATAKSV